MRSIATWTVLRRSLLPFLSLLLIGAAACTSNQATAPTETPEPTASATSAATPQANLGSST